MTQRPALFDLWDYIRELEAHHVDELSESDVADVRRLCISTLEEILPPEPWHPGHIYDWAAKAAIYLHHSTGARASSHRIAAVISHFAEPLVKLLRESKREHYHCEDSWYCCGKCTNADHGLCDGGEDHEHDASCYIGSHDGYASRQSGVCNCGADEWNERIDAVLNGE